MAMSSSRMSYRTAGLGRSLWAWEVNQLADLMSVGMAIHQWTQNISPSEIVGWAQSPSDAVSAGAPEMQQVVNCKAVLPAFRSDLCAFLLELKKGWATPKSSVEVDASSTEVELFILGRWCPPVMGGREPWVSVEGLGLQGNRDLLKSDLLLSMNACLDSRSPHLILGALPPPIPLPLLQGHILPLLMIKNLECKGLMKHYVYSINCMPDAC